MIKRKSQPLFAWFLFADLGLTAVAWVGAYYLRFKSGWIPLHKATPEAELCWRMLPLVLLISALAYQLAGQYAIHRLRRLREEVVSVAKGTALMSLLVIATSFGLHDPYESRATMLLFPVTAALLVLVQRRLAWSA